MKEVFDMLEGHNEKWLKDNTVYLTTFGSRAYGTATPESDLDIRGVAVEPKSHLLGLLNNFEQAIFSEPIDLTVFGLTKFVKLAMEANPTKKIEKLINSCKFLNQLDWSDIADIYVSYDHMSYLDDLVEKCFKLGAKLGWRRDILQVIMKNNDILYFETGELETLDIVKKFIKDNEL